MEKKPYSNKSDDELQKSIKASTIITIMLAATIIGLFCLNLYNGKTGWSLVGVPLPLSTIVFLNYYTIIHMKKELKSREK